MSGKAKTIAAAVLLMALYCARGYGQLASPAILEIDLENFVAYYGDVSDVSKLATDSNATNTVLGRNFEPSVLIADVVAVNGQPAKGTFVYHAFTLNLRVVPNPGQAIADVVRNNINETIFEILKSDGTPIGSIMANGLGVGAAPPGAPLAVTQGNSAIVGGTGAFLGARGQQGQSVQTQAVRLTSMAEDPINRRRNGGGKARYVVHLIPMSRPEIAVTANGPSVVHASDFTLVTAANPASAGETLILYATGLGPTRPGVDPGKPFTASPQQIVNSPVEVLANGVNGDVFYAGGFPGSVDGYHVSFRLPAGIVSGQVSLRVTAAFIPGPEVKIAVK